MSTDTPLRKLDRGVGLSLRATAWLATRLGPLAIASWLAFLQPFGPADVYFAAGFALIPLLAGALGR